MAKFNSAWLLRQEAISILDRRDAGIFHEMIRRLAPHWAERVVDPKNRDGRPGVSAGLRSILLCF